MAKISALVFVAAAAIVVASAEPSRTAFLAAPARRRPVQPASAPHPAPEAVGQPSGPITGGLPATAAVIAGLLIGLAAAPLTASAGIARTLPDFSLSRPEYMQGVDASNAATKPGEVDYVTRSQIQWMQLPKTGEELAQVRERIKDALPKADFVEKAKEHLQELAGKADIPK